MNVDLSTLESGAAPDHWDRDSDLDEDSERGVLKLGELAPEVSQQVLNRLLSKDFRAWTDALARVGNCVRPVRLRGTSDRIDLATGEVLSGFSSADQALGVVHVRCGNRRASECPSCSRLYAADMFHLIRAGVTGGKTVPESVAAHPLVFTTLTAPSFGRVHTSGRCHPGDPARRCPHGRQLACGVVHAEGAEGRRSAALLGQPLCADCYDYASHVVWQWFAPDLWRRFTIALHRTLAHHLGIPAAGLSEVATVQYAKVAEFQRRGAVHFHALIRLDGPRTTHGFTAAPGAVTAEHLAGLVAKAAQAVQLHVPAVDVEDVPRRLVFGRQLDVRIVRAQRPDDDQALSGAQVAGYLAKYSTKPPPTTSLSPMRMPGGCRRPSLTLTSVPRSPPSPPEPAPTSCSATGDGCSGSAATSPPSPAATQSPSANSVGPGNAPKPASLPAAPPGHHSTSPASRPTCWLTKRRPPSWSAAGPTSAPGWANDGETALATAAAARAREYAQEKAQNRHDQQSTSNRTGAGR